MLYFCLPAWLEYKSIWVDISTVIYLTSKIQPKQGCDPERPQAPPHLDRTTSCLFKRGAKRIDALVNSSRGGFRKFHRDSQSCDARMDSQPCSHSYMYSHPPVKHAPNAGSVKLCIRSSVKPELEYLGNRRYIAERHYPLSSLNSDSPRPDRTGSTQSCWQIRPNCRTIFPLLFVFVWFLESKEI